MGVIVKPSFRVHGFIYGDAGNAGMGVYCETQVCGFIYGGAGNAGVTFRHKKHFYRIVPHELQRFGYR